MIRFISLIITFLSALILLLLAFGMVNEKTQMERLDKDLQTIQAKITEQQQANMLLQQTLTEKTEERDIVKADVEIKLHREGYKTTPTAFLTFDDGMSANTMKILDILKEYNIKATFFVVGSQVMSTQVGQQAIVRAAEEGHTIAIHAYNHEYDKIYQSEEAYFEDLYRCRDLIKELTGQTPTIVRLPSGTASAQSFCKQYGDEGLFDRILQRLTNEGYTINDWNIDTKDWSSATTVEGIVDTVAKGGKNRLNATYKTALVLMHDGKKTYTALPDVIETLQTQGYVFEVLPKEFYIYRQR